MLQIELFLLPIHRSTYENYYQRHDERVLVKKKELEAYGTKFDQLSRDRQVLWEEMWFWPPWKFNDIVGYLDIGVDVHQCMAGTIYLKRKHFSKESWERRSRHRTSLENSQFLWYGTVGNISVNANHNSSFFSALSQVLDEARSTIKQRNRNFKLWIPPFGFDCIDFVKAYKQTKKKIKL